jgi:FMN phosphatase YigB (HAD superfamily)
VNEDYRVLLIDLDRTVVDYDVTEAAALRDVHRALYADRIGFVEFAEAFAACNARLWQGYRRGEGDLDGLRVERFARLGLAVPPAQAAALYERCLGLRAVLFDDVRGALDLLARRFRLILVTDGIAHVQHAKLWQTRLSGVFEKIVISAEAGHRKPAPELLWHALEAAGEPVGAALVVGDSCSSDGVGARSAGIDFCWVRRGDRRRHDAGVPVRFQVRDLGVLAQLLLKRRPPVSSRPPAASVV